MNPTAVPAPPRPTLEVGAAGAPVGVRRRPVLEVCARVAGSALGVASGVVGRVRVRPLHPDGIALAGRLHRTGVPAGGRPSGVAWLDTRGGDDVVVRLSRGGGLPRWLPDVHGLAFTADDGDLLLSTAASTLPGLRHVPWPRRRHGTATYNSLVSFEGACGPVMIAARATAARPASRTLPIGERALVAELGRAPVLLDLLWASPSSRWQPFGTLAIMATAGLASDRGVRFDPFRTPTGLATQRWVHALRAPAYTAARRRPGKAPDGG